MSAAAAAIRIYVETVPILVVCDRYAHPNLISSQLADPETVDSIDLVSS